MCRMRYCNIVCLILASSCWFADCNKINRLTRLVQLIASRQDLESADRQEDTANLLDKLNYLELQLNESNDNFQCSTNGQPEIDPTATRETGANNDMLRIMKAFQEEKQIIKTLQRQVPEVNKTVDSFYKMLGNLTSVVTTRGELLTPADLDSVSIIAKMEEMFNPVKMELTKKLNDSEAVQNQLIASFKALESVARQDSTALLLERMNYLELQLNDSVNNCNCRKTCQPENDPTSIKEVIEQLNKLSEAVQNLSTKVDEIADRSNKNTSTNMDVTENIVKSTPVTIGKTNSATADEMAEKTTATTNMDVTENTVKSTPVTIGKTDSATVGEMAHRSGKTTATTNMDMTENTVKSTSPTIEKMDSCLSHYHEGRTENGVYTVYPLQDNNPVKVYCDMTTDGGGWTVFQRRMDGSVDFLRNWQNYKQGFGSLTGEFWLGNDNIASLTSTCCHELRIELEDFDDVRKYAKYGKFKVLPESDNYKLEVSLYSGNANDSLEYHNGMEFSTTDRDNDEFSYQAWSSGNCALHFKGAWWYNACHVSNLNGMYLKGPNTAGSKGVNWRYWRGYKYSLKMTEMKLR